MSSFAKCGPRSERIRLGEPKRPKCSRRQRHADSAVLSLQWNSSVHLKNESTMTSTCVPSGKGPMKSMLRTSKSILPAVVNLYTLIGMRTALIFWQHGQYRTNNRTWLRMYGQERPMRPSLCIVRSTPPWPTRKLWACSIHSDSYSEASGQVVSAATMKPGASIILGV